MKLKFLLLLPFFLLIAFLIGCQSSTDPTDSIDTTSSIIVTSPTKNDASFDLPIQLTETINVILYFSNQLDEGWNCNEPWPLQRTIAKTDNLPLTALQELLKGPTLEDADRDYFTNINPNVTIQSFKIENATAYVDFDETLEQAVGGSCRVGAIRAQIEKTLLEFPEITQVQLSINGRTEDILQP